MKVQRAEPADKASITIGHGHRHQHVLESRTNDRIRIIRVGLIRFGRFLSCQKARYTQQRKQSFHVYLVGCPVEDAGFGSCSVYPCNKSTTCGTRAATAFNESTAPRGDPGKVTIRVPPLVNPPPRESGANFVLLSPSLRISSPNPGISR